MRETYEVELCGVVPEAMLADANALAGKLGYGAIFTASVSVSGFLPATHYGFSAWVKPSFDALLTEARQSADVTKLVRKDADKLTPTAKEQVVFNVGLIVQRGDYDDMLRDAGLRRAVLDIALPPDLRV